MDIAEAVKVYLAAGDFSLEITPERGYVPSFELAELAALKCVVVARGQEQIKLTRADVQTDVKIDVGILKKVDDILPATLDPLMAFVQELLEYCRGVTLTADPGGDDEAAAVWLGTESDPIYSTDHLTKFRQFTSVFTLTYRVISA